jgi:ankyrin repeat protein
MPIPSNPPRPGLLVDAVVNYDLNAVKRLLQQGANVNDTDAFGESALCRALTYGYMDIARILIENGADLNTQNRLGNTPLIIVINTSYASGREDIARLLLQKGANIDIKNKAGETAMSIALSQQRPTVIKMLKDEKANRKVIAEEFARAAAAKRREETFERQRRLKELAKKFPRISSGPKAA